MAMPSKFVQVKEKVAAPTSPRKEVGTSRERLPANDKRAGTEQKVSKTINFGQKRG